MAEHLEGHGEGGGEVEEVESRKKVEEVDQVQKCPWTTSGFQAGKPIPANQRAAKPPGADAT